MPPLPNSTEAPEGVEWGLRDGELFFPGGPPTLTRRRGDWYFYVPLWMVSTLLLIPAVVLWRIDRRPRPGHCPECGYDLAGLATGGVCPECGQIITAR
jgi:hypothetical protein